MLLTVFVGSTLLFLIGLWFFLGGRTGLTCPVRFVRLFSIGGHGRQRKNSEKSEFPAETPKKSENIGGEEEEKMRKILKRV